MPPAAPGSNATSAAAPAAEFSRGVTAEAAWPFGDSEAARLIRERDWSATPLGPCAGWSPSLRAAVELVLASPCAMTLEWGEEGVLFYNDAYSRFAGSKHPWAFGRPVEDVWPEVADFSRRTRAAVLDGETRSFRGLRAQLDRGVGVEPIWLDLDYSPVRDGGPAPVAALVVVAETTERLRAEQRQTALLKLGDRLRSAKAEAEIVQVAAEVLGEALEVARAGYAQVDDAQQQFRGESDWTRGRMSGLAGAEPLASFGPGLIAALRLGEVAIVNDVEADARTAGWPGFGDIGVRSQLSVPLLEGGRLVAVLYVHHDQPRAWSDSDVTLMREVADRTWAALEHAHAEAALRGLNQTLEQRVADALADRQLWADIWEATDDPVAAVDSEFRLLAANKAYRDELAALLNAEVEVGVSLIDALAHVPTYRDTSIAAWRRALSGKVAEASGLGQGEGPFYDIKMQPLHDRQGRRIGAFQYSRNVTARVRAERQLAQAEEQLRQAQKMEAVGQLTGGIAHDFNNLLQGITGSLSLVQKRIEQGRVAEVDRFITGAVTSANRAAALTHRLLAFSRRQPLDPKSVRANALVASMEDLLRRTLGESISLELVLAGGLWPTLCDPNQLESALLNLAINARDAMPTGGKLTIETCNAHLDTAYAAKQRDVKPGQYVCLSVTDTGSGMSPDVIERAFDPFFTTKPIGQGTGLGLSMIYGFARQSEGYAKIYSEVGQGTTVKLYLPRHRGEAAAPEEDVLTLTAAHQAEDGETVLVVEDEPVVRSLIVEVLHELGYHAMEAVDGPSGLEILRSKRRIDLLVTDIGLPGLNGRQLADAARAFRPELRVLFMTGYAENAALANGFLDAGMAMITKPFAMEHLATRIREMIETG